MFASVKLWKSKDQAILYLKNKSYGFNIWGSLGLKWKCVLLKVFFNIFLFNNNGKDYYRNIYVLELLVPSLHIIFQKTTIILTFFKEFKLNFKVIIEHFLINVVTFHYSACSRFFVSPRLTLEKVIAGFWIDSRRKNTSNLFRRFQCTCIYKVQICFFLSVGVLIIDLLVWRLIYLKNTNRDISCISFIYRFSLPKIT